VAILEDMAIFANFAPLPSQARLFFFFGFETTQLARQLHQERTQMEAQ